MSMIKVAGGGTASREPIPQFLHGLAPESLADLSWTDPALGVSSAAWWPEEPQPQDLPRWHVWGDEILTPDADRRVVVSSREIVPMPPDERRAAADAERARLVDAVTAHRWSVETGGITLHGGVQVSTWIEDQNRLTSVIANAELAGVEQVDFKAASGWATLTLPELRAVAAAVALHVQASFSAERAHHEAIATLADDALDSYDITAGWPPIAGLPPP